MVGLLPTKLGHFQPDQIREVIVASTLLRGADESHDSRLIEDGNRRIAWDFGTQKLKLTWADRLTKFWDSSWLYFSWCPEVPLAGRNRSMPPSPTIFEFQNKNDAIILYTFCTILYNRARILYTLPFPGVAIQIGGWKHVVPSFSNFKIKMMS